MWSCCTMEVYLPAKYFFNWLCSLFSTSCCISEPISIFRTMRYLPDMRLRKHTWWKQNYSPSTPTTQGHSAGLGDQRVWPHGQASRLELLAELLACHRSLLT